MKKVVELDKTFYLFVCLKGTSEQGFLVNVKVINSSLTLLLKVPTQKSKIQSLQKSDI